MDEIILLLTRIFNFKFYVQFLTLIFSLIFSILILKWIYATHKIIFTKIKTKKFVESLKKDMCYSVFDDFGIDKK